MNSDEYKLQVAERTVKHYIEKTKDILGKAEGSSALDRRIARVLHRHGIAPKPALVKELVEEMEDWLE